VKESDGWIFVLHGMLIHNNDDNSGHVILSATTPRLPASFNITLLSRLRVDYLFLFKREGRCAGVLIKRYVSISGGLSAHRKGGGRRRLPDFSLHVLGPEIYFRLCLRGFYFFKCVDGQLHFCLTLDAAQFVAHRKNSKVTSVLIKSNWVGTLEVFLKAFWVQGSGAEVEDCVMFNVSVIEIN